MERRDTNSKRMILFKLLENPKNDNLIDSIKENKKFLNEKNKDGNTPLIIALRNKHNEKIIKLIINNKANINHKNNFGNIPS